MADLSHYLPSNEFFIGLCVGVALGAVGLAMVVGFLFNRTMSGR